MDIEKAIRAYIPEVIHLSLATTKDNKPWVCELRYSFDSDLNFYFRSKVDARHSREASENPFVAGDIVVQHSATDKLRGVYFEGTVELLDDVDEQHPAYTTYCERFATDSAILADAQTDTGYKFYKITVHTFYLFDTRESNPPARYELVWGN